MSFHLSESRNWTRESSEGKEGEKKGRGPVVNTALVFSKIHKIEAYWLPFGFSTLFLLQ